MHGSNLLDSWFSADGYLYVLSYMSYFLIYVVFAGILYIIIVVFSTNKLYSDINTDSALELESQVRRWETKVGK